MGLAILNAGAQGLHTVGLLYVSSARASFVAQTSVVWTPVLTKWAGQHVSSTVWWACLLAWIGLITMTASSLSTTSTDGKDVTSSTLSQYLCLGDILCLAGAVCWSLYIYCLSHCGNHNEIHLQAAKNVFLASIYTIWMLHTAVYATQEGGVDSLWLGYDQLGAWALTVYSAAGPGTFADICQQKAQSYVSPSETNIILSVEPLFTAILGRVLLGESMTLPEKLGGALILIAAVLASRNVA